MNEEQIGQLSDSDLKELLKGKTKIEVMDQLLSSEEMLSSFGIIHIINQVFGIDFEKVVVLDKKMLEHLDNTPSLNNDLSQSWTAIDQYLENEGTLSTGAEIRTMINKIFGINLDGIAGLKDKKISLHSKGQWIIQSDTDLVIVQTGPNDIDAKIWTTDYFTEQTGLTTIPTELQDALSHLGYHYDENRKACYFSSPNGEAIPDQFKVQTLGAIMGVIQKSYNHL